MGKTTDVGVKSTGGIAVIFDNEAFYTDVFADETAAFRLPVKRKLADAVVKVPLLEENQDGCRRGRVRWLSL